MDMADVMAVIDEERKKLNLSAEQFAVEVGVTSTTYSRQKNGRQDLGMDSVHQYAGFARRAGNTRILQALAAYAVGLDFDSISIQPSK